MYHRPACVVDFFGDVLIPPFEFPAILHGIDFLQKNVMQAVAKTGAKKMFLRHGSHRALSRESGAPSVHRTDPPDYPTGSPQP